MAVGRPTLDLLGGVNQSWFYQALVDRTQTSPNIDQSAPDDVTADIHFLVGRQPTLGRLGPSNLGPRISAATSADLDPQPRRPLD